MHNEEKYFCRVCGYKYLKPPWGEDGKTPLFEYCDCCGVEFGYGDSTLKSIRKHREKWLSGGAKWLNEKNKPDGWDLKEQLKKIPDAFL